MYSMVVMAALTTGQATPDCCGFFRNMFGCHGYSSCYGSCYGGYSCSGCYGGRVYYGCSGCYGSCYGGCYGSSCYGCHGCYGCAGYTFGSPYQVTPNHPMPKAGESPPPPKEEKKKEEVKSNKAKLIIDLPADAKLYVDNQLMKTASSRRAFSTPVLEPGQSYFYVLRAEVIRDGKTLEQTRRVIVRAGDQVNTSFKELNGAPEFMAKAE